MRNIKDGKIVSAIHGENFLQLVKELPKGEATRHKIFIVGHSETGHHHVLESKTEFDIYEVLDNLYVHLDTPANLVHKKTFDVHETQEIQPGTYKVYHKLEYDPFQDVIRKVYD